MTNPTRQDARPTTPILSFSDVCVHYGSVDAVHHVSFAVEAEDFVCLIGENGSGKSTLVKAALGLVPLSNGRIDFGVPRDRVSYMPQIATAGDDFPATVRELVLSGRQRPKSAFPFYGADDKRAADRTIEAFGLEALAGRRFSALSGGQRQRVLLARAVCKEPALLLLDEPANALDPAIAEQLADMLQRLNREEGVAILMVSHDHERAAHAAKHVAVLHQGLSFYGTVEAWKRWIA